MRNLKVGFGKLKFKGLLIGLGWKLKRLAQKEASFKEALGEKKMVLEFKTSQNEIGCQYWIDNGAIRTGRLGEAKADSLLVFESADCAVKLLTGQDRRAFMVAIAKGRVKILGNPNHLMWFMGLMKYLKR